MYELLLVLVVILFFTLRYRETFVVKYGNPFNDEDLLSFDPHAKGKRIFAITPDTCPTNKSELDAGLCYEACEEGYHGVGPVCWANTQNIGIGRVISYPSCAQLGYRMQDYWEGGLTCNRNIYWDTCAWKSIFGCVGGLKGGEMERKSQPCYGHSDHRDYIDGLCYRQCPQGMRHVPGMPYLCFKGTRGLSYGRGVGDIPPIFAWGA